MGSYPTESPDVEFFHRHSKSTEHTVFHTKHWYRAKSNQRKTCYKKKIKNSVKTFNFSEFSLKILFSICRDCKVLEEQLTMTLKEIIPWKHVSILENTKTVLIITNLT